MILDVILWGSKMSILKFSDLDLRVSSRLRYGHVQDIVLYCLCPAQSWRGAFTICIIMIVWQAVTCNPWATCQIMVTHGSWCMPGSFNPWFSLLWELLSFPGTCATCNFMYHVRSLCRHWLVANHVTHSSSGFPVKQFALEKRIKLTSNCKTSVDKQS